MQAYEGNFMIFIAFYSFVLSNSKCNLAAKLVEMFEETFFQCIKI